MIRKDDTLALWLAINTGGQGGGETWTEEKVWENPDPTAPISQAIQINFEGEYDYIKIEFNASTTDQTKNTIIKPFAEFRRSSRAPNIIMGGWVSPNDYDRAFAYNPTFNYYLIGRAQRVGGSGYNDNVCIPTAIYGIKKG